MLETIRKKVLVLRSNPALIDILLLLGNPWELHMKIIGLFQETLRIVQCGYENFYKCVFGMEKKNCLEIMGIFFKPLGCSSVFGVVLRYRRINLNKILNNWMQKNIMLKFLRKEI